MTDVHRGLPQAESAQVQQEQTAWQRQTLSRIKVECERNLEDARLNYEPTTEFELSPVLQESLGISSPVSSKKSSKESLRVPSRSGSKESMQEEEPRRSSRVNSKERMSSKGSVRRDSKVSVNMDPEMIAPASADVDSPKPEGKIVRRGKLNGGNWRRTITRTISIQSTDIVDTPEFMWQKYLKHFTSPQLDWLSAQFDSYDENMAGMISLEDAIYVVMSWMKYSYRCENPEPTDDMVKAALESCSRGQLDNLTFEHVVSFTKHCERKILNIDGMAGFPEDDVLEFKSVFKDFCKQKGIDGGDKPPALSTLDTFAILEELGRDCGEKESQERVIEIIKEVDENKSGDLDFLEFLHLLRQVQAQDANTARKREKELIQQSGFSDSEVEKFHQLFDLYQGQDGTFTVESLREMFTKIEITMTPERRKYLAGMVHKVTDNNLLTLGEFLVLLHDLLEEDFAEMRSSANVVPERAAYNPLSSNNSQWDDEEFKTHKLTPEEWIEKHRAKLALGHGCNWVTRMIKKKEAIKSAGYR
jgi:Ca2+-binding EF-hand superfamily protein